MFGIFSGDFLAPLVFHSLMIILHVQNDFWNLWTCRVVKKTTSNYPTMRIFARRVSAWTLEPRVLHWVIFLKIYRTLLLRAEAEWSTNPEKKNAKTQKPVFVYAAYRISCLTPQDFYEFVVTQSHRIVKGLTSIVYVTFCNHSNIDKSCLDSSFPSWKHRSGTCRTYLSVLIVRSSLPLTW